MIRNYNIRCYNDFILIIDVFCKKVNWERFILMYLLYIKYFLYL